MKLAIMQPYLFPYIGYYQLISAVDKFIILDDVNYIMRGWINRNRILVNGEEHIFTAPIVKASQNKKITECKLADGPWKEKLIKTIELSYKKAPYYNQVYDFIVDSLCYPDTNLSGWLTYQIKKTCEFLEIKTVIYNSSGTYQNNDLKGQERLIDICKKEKADQYINPIGGTGLYDKNIFKNNSIRLNFLKSKAISYKQFNSTYIPSLSIIDVMMFNEKEIITCFLDEYELL